MYKFAIKSIDYSNADSERQFVAKFSANSFGAADIFFFNWVAVNVECNIIDESVIIDLSGNEAMRIGDHRAEFSNLTYLYEEI